MSPPIVAYTTTQRDPHLQNSYLLTFFRLRSLGGLLAAMLVARARGLLVTVPAIAGVIVCLAAWRRPLDVGGGNIESGHPGFGLILVLVAVVATLIASAVLLVLDLTLPERDVDRDSTVAGT
jgi:hypothetical protein